MGDDDYEEQGGEQTVTTRGLSILVFGPQITHVGENELLGSTSTPLAPGASQMNDQAFLLFLMPGASTRRRRTLGMIGVVVVFNAKYAKGRSNQHERMCVFINQPTNGRISFAIA